MAPTCTGEVFIFNLKTGQVTGVLKDHDGTQREEHHVASVYHCQQPKPLTPLASLCFALL